VSTIVACPPPDHLRPFVDVFWQSRGDASTSERALPTGTVELVVDLRADRVRLRDRDNTALVLPPAVVCGPHTRFFVIDGQSDEDVVGVHFRPGGVAPFLGMPADEIRNRLVPAECIWGASRIERLLDELREAQASGARFAILAAFLEDRRVGAGEPDAAVRFAVDRFVARPEIATVAAVVDRVGLSSRHFARRFLEQVGLAPKAFSRVQRFQLTLRRLEALDRPVLVDLALDCGFFDQAHFANDFRRFTGVAPTAYLRMQRERLNHLAELPVRFVQDGGSGSRRG